MPSKAKSKPLSPVEMCCPVTSVVHLSVAQFPFQIQDSHPPEDGCVGGGGLTPEAFLEISLTEVSCLMKVSLNPWSTDMGDTEAQPPCLCLGNWKIHPPTEVPHGTREVTATNVSPLNFSLCPVPFPCFLTSVVPKNTPQ